MQARSGGAPKYAMDILGLCELVTALCLTLTNLPFVITLTQQKIKVSSIFAPSLARTIEG